MVEQAFREIGCVTHQGNLPTARGKVAVDVAAVQAGPIPLLVLCECKLWQKPVPQSVVHAFWAVCSDAGANLGLIITKKGIQSGAREKSVFTNVHLVTFEQFQETYFWDWRRSCYEQICRWHDQVLPVKRAAIGYHENGLEVVGPDVLEGVNVDKKYQLLFDRESLLSFGMEEIYPLSVVDPRGEPTAQEHVTIKSPRQHFEVVKQGALDATKHFGLPNIWF